MSEHAPNDLADTLFGVARRLRWHVNERMRAAGLSFARLRVLDTLTDGPQRMRDLSNALNVAPRTITGLVDALEEDGLVARSPHATDRRVTVLTITPEGQRLLVTAGRERSKVLAELFGTLSPADCDDLDRILHTLRDAVPDPPDGWKKAKRARRVADVNRLAEETSPYLRQHADNPVDWYPWGEEAFARARAEDKPLLLSVGYSSCHWCHVMAHESFEDPEIAAVMNERFVNVKVDREERPDVDAVYMQAVQAMTGSGGWPMTVFLDPDGRPFFGGTYFPNADRPGMPGFVRVMDAVDEAWRERRADLLEQAGTLHDAIARSTQVPSRDPGDPSADVLGVAVAAVNAQFDERFGGFGNAPKFPQAMTLAFLLAQAVRAPTPETLESITVSLDAMAAGGMYDQVGGGFHRYSVDAYWLVPHFEKMLYDQALLARAYLHGWLVVGLPRYRRIVEEIVEYVLRDLRHADGGFFSAEDADSEGVEGKFYLWSLEEIEELCGADTPEVVRYWGVTAGGNFEDPHTGYRGNILHVVDREEDRPDVVTGLLPRLLAARADARASRSRRQGAPRLERAVPALARRGRVRVAARRLDGGRAHERPVPPARAPRATTAASCVRGRAGAPTSSRTPRTTPRCSRRSSRWPRSTTSPGSARRGSSPTTSSACSPTTRTAASSPRASTPNRSSCARRTTRTTRPRPRTPSPPNGLLRLAAITGDAAYEAPRLAVDPHDGAAARRAPHRVRLPARGVRAAGHAADRGRGRRPARRARHRVTAGGAAANG